MLKLHELRYLCDVNKDRITVTEAKKCEQWNNQDRYSRSYYRNLARVAYSARTDKMIERLHQERMISDPVPIERLHPENQREPFFCVPTALAAIVDRDVQEVNDVISYIGRYNKVRGVSGEVSAMTAMYFGVYLERDNTKVMEETLKNWMVRKAINLDFGVYLVHTNKHASAANTGTMEVMDTGNRTPIHINELQSYGTLGPRSKVSAAWRAYRCEYN